MEPSAATLLAFGLLLAGLVLVASLWLGERRARRRSDLTLNALTEQIKSDGNTPWCMGIESDTATGWPATDWFETLVAKYGGAEGYNSWVTHETPFDSDLVREAAAEFEELMFTDGNVLGGREAMASTNFGTAGNPMFDAKPGCWMYNQGSFITGFCPEDILADLDRPHRLRRGQHEHVWRLHP